MYSHLPPLLEHFSEIVYPGLDAFLIEDVEAFFTDESQFSFALKKVRGQGVLYGFDHVDLRARMVNDLPKADRLRIMLAKFKHAGIFSDFELSQIQDVLDIGMGHSVYGIQFSDKKWVLKARDPKHQLFYCDLLESLGWPSFKAKSIQTENGFWELSEYLKGDVLGSLFHPGACLSGSIEKELASHAALGDVMGRGDRHFENYVVSEGHIYPVDLSHLFWVDNEIWVNRYISGGMAEFSSLGFFSNDPVVFCSKIESFFYQYVEKLKMLKSKQLGINDKVYSFFKTEI